MSKDERINELKAALKPFVENLDHQFIGEIYEVTVDTSDLTAAERVLNRPEQPEPPIDEVYIQQEVNGWLTIEIDRIANYEYGNKEPLEDLVIRLIREDREQRAQIPAKKE